MADGKLNFVEKKQSAYGKVTCLGLTFDSEKKRREYFRSELQKKLPELKKIEGYPIGEDEDIIALSDPPYYTACPNPWLKDFIKEWEKEKEKILGRNKAFRVDEPYASDVSEGKNNPIYYAHSYHTKVPHPAIMRYILHYTQPGDIVFDGFAGTGMTGVAAQKCGDPDSETKSKIEKEWKEIYSSKPKWGARKAICGDLSPAASFISYNFNIPLNFSKVEKTALDILDKLENKWSWIYETKHSNKENGSINYVIWSDIFICNNCGKEIVFWNSAVDSKRTGVSSEFYCPYCKSLNSKQSSEKQTYTTYDKALDKIVRLVKKKPVLISYFYKEKKYEKIPDDEDISKLESINLSIDEYWFPTDALPEGHNTRQPKESHHLSYVHQFYSLRSLLVLSILWNKFDIHQRFILTSIIVKTASLLHNIGLKNGKINLAGALPNVLYIPSNIAERNIFELVKGKFKDFRFKRCDDYSLVQTCSATEVPINSSSVDYIFVDPPFGSNIMYSELNFIWESWLKVWTDNKEEAIENKSQNKNLLSYLDLITRCFKEYYRVLKPNKWMTVEFSNTSAAVWNGIQTALQKAGFIIANIAALDKQQGSFKAQTTPTAVKQDLIISCYKPSAELESKFKIESSEIELWKFVNEHLQHLPIHIRTSEKTTAVVERSPKILYDRLITFYLMRGLPIPIDSVDFQLGLKQRFAERDGMYFTQEHATEYDELYENRKGEQYLLVFDSIYSESDAVLWLRERLQKKPQTYQDIMPDFRKANRVNRKGELVAELKTVLEENFIKEDDGKWRVPNMNEAKDREALRNKSLLKEFDKYKEELDNPKTKKIKEVRVEALRAGFKMCWEKKDFKTIVNLGDKISQNILLEDEQLLMYYDIAKDRI
jgi:DNA modification methylase